MQKKLIAIVVTLAMLLSTFGVVAPVFAAGGPYTVTADKDEILTATTTNVKVTIKDGGATNKDRVYYGLFEGNKLISTGSTSAGTVTVPINAEVDHNVKYYVVVDADSTVLDDLDGANAEAWEAFKEDEDTEEAWAEIVSKHNLTLTVPSIKVGDTKTISGKVVDGAGDSLEERPTIAIYKGETLVASTRASSSGSFALAANFESAGKYIVTVTEAGGDELEYDDFSVGADKSLKVTVDKTSVLTGRDATLVVTVKDGSTELENAVVEISGIKADIDDDGIYEGEDEEVLKGASEIYAFTNPDGKATFNAKFIKSGTAKVRAMWNDKDEFADGTLAEAIAAFDDDNIDEYGYKGEGSFKVVRPSDFNISISDDEVDAVVPFDLTVEYWSDDEEIEKVDITVVGCGIDEEADNNDDADADDDLDVGDDYIKFKNLVPECGGEIVVTAVAKLGNGDKITKTETIEVDGWIVTVTPETVTYGDKYEFKAVVTKADETPVNNAIVWLKVDDGNFVLADNYDAEEYDDDDEDWIDFAEIDSRDTNINNGIYEKTVRFNEVGTVIVLVTDADADNDYTPKTYVEIDVEGEDVYDVDAPAQLVAGLEEDVEFTVKDEDGAYVKDNNAYVTIDGKDYKDLDRDGNVYSFSFVHDEAEELDLVFKTDNGEFIGKTTIEVLAPKLVLPNEDTKLTYMVEETWEVKLVDPRDDSVIEDAYLYITPDNCLLEIDGDELDEEEDEFEIDLGNGEEEFDLLAYAQDDDDDPMLLTFEVEIDDGPRVEVAEIEVVGMSITASPATIGVDTVSTVTITVLDAHGKPYAGKDVELSGPLTAESETDEDGKVVFKIKPVSTGKITIEVETDAVDEDGDDVFAEGEIKVSLDAAGAGVITMQLGNKTAVANGSMSTLDVAPFAENGRTLVPFRYIAEAIGAYVEFIAPDKVVYRLRVDENTVNEVWLTIGSTVASVNGVEQTLEVAPKIVDGRTVVPLRFVGEAFGFYVDYNFGTEVITLTK